jgi:acetyl-CoA decarbonylase/synthase complex subunit gamma
MKSNCCDREDLKLYDGGPEKRPLVLPILPSQECEIPVRLPGLNQPFVTGSVDTAVGRIPLASSFLTWRDHWGTIKARWGVGRMDYMVEPGLYALDHPDNQSPVLATANYKMSFDRLREVLPGRSAWILVLDTAGINVWCAAGKGTFGTGELVRRIASSGLDQVVSHRELILPQLAGPGVAAHQVKKFSGFRVHYGPVRASDLPAYLDAGLRATPEMRVKTFPFRERTALIPIELVQALKAGFLLTLLFLIISGLGGPDGYLENIKNYGVFAAATILSAVLAGTVLTPLLLPALPGRAFSIKGMVLGFMAAAGLLILRNPDLSFWPGRLEALAMILMVSAVTAYLALNFTGASTYTSLSGVKKEMRIALPLEIGAGIAGFFLWLASRFMA